MREDLCRDVHVTSNVELRNNVRLLLNVELRNYVISRQIVERRVTSDCYLTISVLQACCAVTTEYGIPSNFIRKSIASLQIKISTAQLNFLNRNVMIF